MAGINCVVVLAPNGRRQKVKVTPNTTVLQIIEEVCAKQNLESAYYHLKHHNHVLDSTNPLRYLGLPNNALLEITKLEIRRIEAEVTVSLMCESGERFTGRFLPSGSLWDIVIELIPNFHFDKNKTPVIVYVQQDIAGAEKLRQTTLRNLGVMSGRVLLRLILRNEDDVPHQACVTTPLPPQPFKSDVQPRFKAPQIISSVSPAVQGASPLYQHHGKSPNFLETNGHDLEEMEVELEVKNEEETRPSDMVLPAAENNVGPSTPSASVCDVLNSASNTPKRPLSSSATNTSEDEAKIFVLGERNAIAFSLSTADALRAENLPDEFYELTVKDVQTLYRDLKNARADVEQAPLQTRAFRELEHSKKVLSEMSKYVKTVIRIHFPDRTVLQAVFSPIETIETVSNFIRGFLENQSTAFYLYTTPPKSILQPSTRLVEAHCVPNAVIHFGPEEPFNGETRYLKSEVSAGFLSYNMASVAASQTRILRDQGAQETKPHTEEPSSTTKTEPMQGTSCDTTKTSKLITGKNPKWFKTSKK